MRGTVKAALTAGLALALTGFALAQQQEPGGTGGPADLLMVPAVRKELKLTDEQVGKLKDALGKVMQDHRPELEKLRNASPEQAQKVMEKVGEDIHKAVAGVLDAKQMKRFQQIQWQLGGIGALGDPEVEKELKMTEAQKKKLLTIFQDADKQMQEVARGGNREGAREKFEKIHKDTEAKVYAVLTDDQKKTWKEIQGEPFKLPQPGR